MNLNSTAKVFCLITTCVLLISCGGKEDQAAGEPATDDAGQTGEAPTPRANNPLARQQQLIRDAQGIQAILDKDAEEKKNALKNID